MYKDKDCINKQYSKSIDLRLLSAHQYHYNNYLHKKG